MIAASMPENILRYVTREGQPDFALAKGNYCAAAACWAYKRALGPSEEMPFPYRASGLEMTEDAKKAGTWVPIRDVRSGAYPASEHSF